MNILKIKSISLYAFFLLILACNPDRPDQIRNTYVKYNIKGVVYEFYGQAAYKESPGCYIRAADAVTHKRYWLRTFNDTSGQYTHLAIVDDVNPLTVGNYTSTFEPDFSLNDGVSYQSATQTFTITSITDNYYSGTFVGTFKTPTSVIPFNGEFKNVKITP